MNFWDADIPESLLGLELKTFLNKKRIIKYLYRQGTLSGSDISKILKVSAPTSNLYLNELVAEGYIEVKGKGVSLGGRKPNVYGLKKDSVYIVGIDVGRKFLGLALFDNDLQKVASIESPALSLDNRDVLIKTIFTLTQSLLDEVGVDMSKVMGVGINMPGLIDSDKGINYTYLYDENISLTDAFCNVFNKPVFIENDSKARALAEMRFGLAKDYDNALVIQIDWGLGLGMILNGKLFKGKSGFAGEFSHIPIEQNGVLCNCGKIGCLETIASGNALVRYAIEGLEGNKQSKLYKYYKDDINSISPKLIVEVALKGDQFALSLIQKIGSGLGKGISYLIQILNPEIVIIGGVLSKAGQYIETSVKQSIYQYCISNLHEDVELKISTLGNESGLIGSAIVVLENILENNW